MLQGVLSIRKGLDQLVTAFCFDLLDLLLSDTTLEL
jgi:hypothetical protein